MQVASVSASLRQGIRIVSSHVVFMRYPFGWHHGVYACDTLHITSWRAAQVVTVLQSEVSVSR